MQRRETDSAGSRHSDGEHDLSLDDYGPEALSERANEMWGSDQNRAQFVATNFAAALRNLDDREAALANLHPSTDAQKQALATANTTIQAIAQSRLQMSFALSDPVSYPLIWSLVGWGAIIFCGFGLTSKPHPMSVITAMVGALALATAFYLILDLSNPYAGLFRASPNPLEQVLAVMGKE